MSSGELLVEHPNMNPAIIEGLLRFCEVMNVIASPKAKKSWLILYLALCIATGRAFLGRYPLKRGRVLLLDNELHKGTLRNRLKQIAEAMGLCAHEYEAHLDITSVRGKGVTVDRLRQAFAKLAGTYSVIIIDALYKALPLDVDENSNSDMGRVYNELDALCEIAGCAIIVVHHMSKGIQSDKAVTDLGARAGTQSRAADVHLAIREHNEPGCVSVDAGVRSWAPIEPFVMRWSYPLWSIDETLDPADLKRAKTRRERMKGADDLITPNVPPPEPWTAERFAMAFITSEPRSQADILALAGEQEIGLRKRDELIRLARAKGLAHVWSFPKTNAVFLATRPQTVAESVSPTTPGSEAA